MGALMEEADKMEIKGLKAVRVKKADLLEKIKASREQHVKDFKEASDGYKLKVIAELAKALQDAKEGKEYRTYLHLEEPHDHTKDYDRVIAMLEMSVDTELELPASEFSRYALDEWEWSHQFAATKAAYSKAGK